MAKITLFSKNNSMQCKMTKKFLEKEGADFEEINIDEQPEKIDYVKSLGFYCCSSYWSRRYRLFRFSTG